jgi:Uma2 family endonuclease
LGADLGSAFDRGRGGPGGWIILDEPELHLGSEPDIIVPDIAGWRRERMPEVPDVVYFTLAPDWVCEVLSPRTEKLDRSDKMTIYAREGVRHVWLLAPDKRLLEVYRLDAGDWRRVAVYRDEDTPRAEPFEAIELELAALWIAPAPESP